MRDTSTGRSAVTRYRSRFRAWIIRNNWSRRSGRKPILTVYYTRISPVTVCRIILTDADAAASNSTLLDNSLLITIRLP